MSSVELTEILKWARKQPFVPFTLTLTSGTEIAVDHAEEIFFLPSPERISHIEVFSRNDFHVFGPPAVVAITATRKSYEQLS